MLEFGISWEPLVLLNDVRLKIFVVFSFARCINESRYWSLEKDFMILFK